MAHNSNILNLNKKAWDNIADKYEKHRPDWLEKPHPLFEFFCLNLPRDSYVLDIGSGTGLPNAKLLIQKGFKVLGIDISNEMIKVAQKNVPRAQFIQLSMTDLSYEKMFEGVISSFSMLHLEPKQFKSVAKRIIRALKKDGIFFLLLNEPLGEDGDIDETYETIIEIMGQKMYSRPYYESEVVNIFNPLGMKLIKTYREIQVSELFGEEHTLSFVFKKS